jgi:hypothetical protein
LHGINLNKNNMKTLNIIVAMLLISASAVFAQDAKKGSMTNTYFVMTTHTPEQCMNNAMELKEKGETYISKFWFGCHSGDHTGYAFLTGNSEDDVRKMLVKNAQASAKIMKVDKFTIAEIEKLHEDMMKKK